MQHAGPARADSVAACSPRVDAAAAASTPISRTDGVVDEVVEQADGVAAAADAGDGVVGQPPLALQHLRPAPRGR